MTLINSKQFIIKNKLIIYIEAFGKLYNEKNNNRFIKLIKLSVIDLIQYYITRLNQRRDAQCE